MSFQIDESFRPQIEETGAERDRLLSALVDINTQVAKIGPEKRAARAEYDRAMLSVDADAAAVRLDNQNLAAGMIQRPVPVSSPSSDAAAAKLNATTRREQALLATKAELERELDVVNRRFVQFRKSLQAEIEIYPACVALQKALDARHALSTQAPDTYDEDYSSHALEKLVGLQMSLIAGRLERQGRDVAENQARQDRQIAIHFFHGYKFGEQPVTINTPMGVPNPVAGDVTFFDVPVAEYFLNLLVPDDTGKHIPLAELANPADLERLSDRIQKVLLDRSPGLLKRISRKVLHAVAKNIGSLELPKPVRELYAAGEVEHEEV